MFEGEKNPVSTDITFTSMNILILGSGGRESAFAWKIAQSKHCSNLFIAPGNAGTRAYGKNIPIEPTDFESIAKFVLGNKIDLVLVGPEKPLVNGIHDFFLQRDDLKQIAIVGPQKEGASWRGARIFQNSL